MSSHEICYQDRMRRARLDSGHSQTSLAAAIGVSVTLVSAVERAKRDVMAPTLFAWARECKAALEWIASGEQPTQAQDPSAVALIELQELSA